MTGPLRVFSVAHLIHKWMSSVVCQMTLLLRSDAEAARFSIGRGPSKRGRRRSTCDRSMRGQAARVLISCATRLLQCRPADPAGAASAHQGSGRDAADERSRRALERLPEHSSKCDGSRCSRRRLPLAPVWHLRADERAYACKGLARPRAAGVLRSASWGARQWQRLDSAARPYRGRRQRRDDRRGGGCCCCRRSAWAPARSDRTHPRRGRPAHGARAAPAQSPTPTDAGAGNRVAGPARVDRQRLRACTNKCLERRQHGW